jgi:hypothetical protein
MPSRRLHDRPGTMTREMVLLDGITRKGINNGLNLPFKYRYFDGSAQEEAAFIMASNMDRRQMSLDAAAALKSKYWLPIFRESSKAAMSEGGAKGGASKGKAKASEVEGKGFGKISEGFSKACGSGAGDVWRDRGKRVPGQDLHQALRLRAGFCRWKL